MIIEARSLVKSYVLGGNTVKALDGLDLDVAEGEMLAITGPSGSSKSTLNLLDGRIASET
jgi:putative ABC transport system ATP-binding protein